MHQSKTVLIICLVVASAAVFALVGSGTAPLTLRGSAKTKSVGFHAKRFLLRAFIYASKKYDRRDLRSSKPDCAKIEKAAREAKSCIPRHWLWGTTCYQTKTHCITECMPLFDLDLNIWIVGRYIVPLSKYFLNQVYEKLATTWRF